ncbi:ABC transporter ATP-binding protein [Rubrimonas sp.]|uniref:ABC transporter ATP-binding protein n=1 Tax=Rubrimonas sp. TaxID=2036015 RepID=UPI002FDD9C99
MIETYRAIFDLLDRRERRRFVLVMALILVMGVVEAAGVASILPFLAVLANPSVIETNALLARAYALGGFESVERFLMALGMLVFVIVLGTQGVRALTLFAVVRYAQMRNFSFSRRLLSGYLAQPYAWFLNRHTAELGKTVLSEVDLVVGGAVLPAMRIVAYGVVTLCLTALIFIADPVVALSAAGLIGGAYFAIFSIVRRVLNRLGEERVVANRSRFKMASESLGGIKDVKVLGLESVYAERFRAPARRFALTLALGAVIGELPRHVMEALLFGAMILLILAMMATRPGGFQEILPLLGLYAFAGARLFPAMQQLYYSTTLLRFNRPALMSLHADMMAVTNVAPPPVPVAPLPLEKLLELRGVVYAYPNTTRKALDGFDLAIRARTTIGLVGGSGAGKTTAVDVLLGLLPPQEGRMLVDGVEIGPNNVAAWRRSVGYVPQQIFLTDDTVAANIAFGVPPEAIDMAALERAARIAELHDFVTGSMSEGYATLVGERGVRLSGGQRQRIGIARALYHDPSVLIMDEATSALDTLTERAVMDAVHNIGHAKTIVLIAHRLSTVRACDMIFLLENGRVAAQGTYDELVQRSERFRAMAGAGETGQ